jgi:four helix bundle protein
VVKETGSQKILCMNSENYKGGFRQLEAWKQARVLRQQIIEDCKTFPKDEKFLLAAQIKDSSRSVTANMAEGYGRFHYQETMQFFRDSRGSLNETLDHLITALDEGYISKQVFTLRAEQYETTLKLINGYLSFLQKEKEKQNKTIKDSATLPNTSLPNTSLPNTSLPNTSIPNVQ